MGRSQGHESWGERMARKAGAATVATEQNERLNSLCERVGLLAARVERLSVLIEALVERGGIAPPARPRLFLVPRA